MNLPLLLRTIAPLRREQLLWRPWRIGQKRLYRHLPFLTRRWTTESITVPVATSRVQAFREIIQDQFPHLVPPPESAPNWPDELAAGRFTFLNRTLELGVPDWNQRYVSHLWNYQLHYFPFVIGAARRAAETQNPRHFAPCQRLIESWIERARPGVSDGWDAYPVSLRVVNWIYGYALLAATYPDSTFLARWRGSIWRQLDYLAGHLEYHLLANHLFRNIRALVIGGLFFDQPEWLKAGEALLWREVEEQILPDGGHYERAPMYHAQTLGDLLECVALLRRFGREVPATIDERMLEMAGFLAALSYDDSELALFNDSANTVETRPAGLLAAVRKITGQTSHPVRLEFPATGYYLWQAADGREKIIIDAGPPAVSYNTAHAHCDLLSFELRLDGAPWIIDSGVHGYGDDPYRQYCRSTRAHNTVMIDGQEQSEIWSTFRMGRMARPLAAAIRTDQEQWEFRGAASYYARPRIRHERRIHRDPRGGWTIADCLTGGQFDLAASFLHLDPAVEVTAQADGSYLLRRGRTVRRLVTFGGLEVEWHDATAPAAATDECLSWHFPEFGIARRSHLLCGRFSGAPGATFGFELIPADLNS